MKERKEFDTIVVPAQETGFQKEFIDNNQWFQVRIGKDNISKIKYIAAYRAKPTSAITHYAEVKNIEKYGTTNKYILFFKSPAKEISPIPVGESLPPQSPRYTSLEKLLNAKTLSDL
jgi:hypothetical protein